MELPANKAIISLFSYLMFPAVTVQAAGPAQYNTINSQLLMSGDTI